uniref:Uncharacterized protein n=1 Tax=Anguilla anguilla TaxID=7936 RepID=A0A0E9TDL8_ANGAN
MRKYGWITYSKIDGLIFTPVGLWDITNGNVTGSFGGPLILSKGLLDNSGSASQSVYGPNTGLHCI